MRIMQYRMCTSGGYWITNAAHGMEDGAPTEENFRGYPLKLSVDEADRKSFVSSLKLTLIPDGEISDENFLKYYSDMIMMGSSQDEKYKLVACEIIDCGIYLCFVDSTKKYASDEYEMLIIAPDKDMDAKFTISVGRCGSVIDDRYDIYCFKDPVLCGERFIITEIHEYRNCAAYSSTLVRVEDGVPVMDVTDYT